MSQLPAEFFEQYRSMQARYLEQVREQLPVLAGFDPERADPAGLEPLRKVAHNLRGSAGFYGYPAIGAAAATLEDWLVAVMAGESDLSPADLRRLLAGLMTAVKAASPPRAPDTPDHRQD